MVSTGAGNCMVSVDLDAATLHKNRPPPTIQCCRRAAALDRANGKTALKDVIVYSQPLYRLGKGPFEMGSTIDGKALRFLLFVHPAPHYQLLYIRQLL